MNNLQKIFLICGIINVFATILFYVETNNFVLSQTGYREIRAEEQIKRDNPDASERLLRRLITLEYQDPSGNYVKTGYAVDWKTAVPFHLIILSSIGFFLFKDK